MKTKYLLTTTLLVLAFLSQSLVLQAQRHHRPGPKMDLEQHKEALNLTDAQVSQLTQLKEETKAQIMAIKQDENLDHTQKKAQVRNLMEEQKANISEILDEEQIAKLKELRKAARMERREQMQNVDRKALKEELKAHYTNEVQPVLLAQRAKLETSLSQEDKALLSNMRSEIKAAKEAHHAARKAAKEARKENLDGEEGRRGFRGRHRNIDPEQKEAMRAKKEAIKAMAEKYDTEITALLEEIKPQAEEWREEHDAILTKHGLEKKGQEGHGSHGRKRGFMGKKHPLGKISFLLLDPNQTEQADLGQDFIQPSISELSVYPNPARAASTLVFNVEKAGTYQIELRNDAGQTVRRVADDYFSAGEQKFNVNLSGLRDGVYFITVTDQDGQVDTKRLVVGN